MQFVRNSSAYGMYEQEYLAWYERRFNNPGRPFDPASLAQAVREQFPEKPEWAEAFARCTHEWPESGLYTHFVSPREMEERWDYAGGFFLEHPTLGTLTVDTIHDKDAPGAISIGGIEYLDRVFGHRVPAEEILNGMHIARKKFNDLKQAEEDGHRPAH